MLSDNDLRADFRARLWVEWDDGYHLFDIDVFVLEPIEQNQDSQEWVRRYFIEGMPDLRSMFDLKDSRHYQIVCDGYIEAHRILTPEGDEYDEDVTINSYSTYPFDNFKDSACPRALAGLGVDYLKDTSAHL